jgi:chromosome segregation ATPase
VSSLPPDAAAALSRIAAELTAVRATLAELTQRVGALTDDNASLRTRLERSEATRGDLLAQTEHIVELLANARTEIRNLQAAAAKS